MTKKPNIKEFLDFDIRFCERLLKQRPNFVDALMVLAEAYTRRGWYHKGLAVDLRLIELREEDPISWYNLACSYSLLGRLEDALSALRQSVKHGYQDAKHMLQDKDLSNLRRSPKFRSLIKQLSSEQTKSLPPGPKPTLG